MPGEYPPPAWPQTRLSPSSQHMGPLTLHHCPKVFLPTLHAFPLPSQISLGSALSPAILHIPYAHPHTIMPQAPSDPTIPPMPHWVLPCPLTASMNPLDPKQTCSHKTDNMKLLLVFCFFKELKIDFIHCYWNVPWWKIYNFWLVLTDFPILKNKGACKHHFKTA